MNLASPSNPRFIHAMRLAGFFLGVLLFVWFPFEDMNQTWPIIFASLISFLLAILVWQGLSPAQRRMRAILPLGGLLCGLCITPITLFLMAFKTGLHGHVSPDFTPAQINAVLAQTPLWIAAGFLVGASLYLLRKSH